MREGLDLLVETESLKSWSYEGSGKTVTDEV